MSTRVNIELKGFGKEGVSVHFRAHYLIGGYKDYEATTEDGVTYWATILGHPTSIEPVITQTTVHVDPDSNSTVNVILEPEK